ncbi:MAG TPA: hypothetical protein VEB42_13010, partial [Chitinophagaceae bacterium]|nr:hypothetical protein [Chitinophagaceae bacterium]
SSIDKDGQYQTSLSEKGRPYRLDEQKELVIFRIFQQHLNNIIYSKPRKVEVELEYQPKHLSLAVSDDGRDTEQEDEEIKTGIRNMRDRALRIGADIQFTKFTGGGTRIFIDLPLK